jgi:hypothetical protein
MDRVKIPVFYLLTDKNITIIVMSLVSTQQSVVSLRFLPVERSSNYE